MVCLYRNKQLRLALLSCVSLHFFFCDVEAQVTKCLEQAGAILSMLTPIIAIFPVLVLIGFHFIAKIGSQSDREHFWGHLGMAARRN